MKMLVLARGDEHSFTDLSGRSVLNALPFEVVVITDKFTVKSFANVDRSVDVKIVRWGDPSQVIQCAEQVHRDQRVFAVAALSERLIEFAAELRVALKVPGLKPEDARRYRDKMVMKKILNAASIRVPQNAYCESRQEVERLLQAHGKLVIKPLDGLGSRDVVFIHSSAELEQWYAQHADVARFEAEEFIEGVLYHVNSLVRGGEVVFSATAIYLPGMANIDFSKGAPFASLLLVDGELKERLEDYSRRAIGALGVKDGVTHLECFVTPADEIVFCETAIRPGGAGIIPMIESQYGINYSRAALLLEGGRGDLLPRPHVHGNQQYGFLGLRHATSGIAKCVPAPANFPEPWISHVRIDVEAGGFVAAAAHCSDYLGLFVFSSNGRAQFESRMEELRQRFYSNLEIE